MADVKNNENLTPADWANSFQKKFPNDALNNIIELLVLSNSLPNIQLQRGRSYGAYKPLTNTIELNPGDRGFNPNTVTHEYAHALDRIMQQRAYERSRWDRRYNPTQFEEGYHKLMPVDSKLPGVKAGLTKDPYRYNSDELRAFGMGEASGDLQPYVAPVEPHIDSTMATEMSILMDLFKRDLMKKKAK